MASNYVACCNYKCGFQNINDLPERELLCQPDFQDHWALAESLLAWNTKISLAAACHLIEGSDVAFDNSVASIWSLFVARLRLAAKWDPAHLSYVDKLIDDLRLENPL